MWNDPLISVLLALSILAISTLMLLLGFPRKYLPIFSLLAGLIVGVIMYRPHWVHAVVVGLALGLVPTGLFSGVKNVKEAAQDDFRIE